MNIIQKYWSYFSRITVEKTSSPYNPKLIVAIQEGKYVLNTSNANYSFGSLHRVFQQTFKKIKLKEQVIESILVLGGGVGSIPSIIYDELEMNPTMDAVEIDEKVITLGNKYFQLSQYNKLSIHIEDAMHYIENTTSMYDLIVVDLFEGIDVPKEFYSPSFLNQLKVLLNKEGMLVFNFVAYNYDTKELAKTIEIALQKIFNTKVERFNLEKVNVVYCVKI
ncbi:MAG: fused MFS/spermidine synthase [Vicingus serpentipes]|nr:fused MFS/spermidine synthase [Vicingus serpentipes]